MESVAIHQHIRIAAPKSMAAIGEILMLALKNKVFGNPTFKELSLTERDLADINIHRSQIIEIAKRAN